MAKTQAITAISPTQFGLSRPAIADGTTRSVRAILARLSNWLFGYRRQSHIALTTAADGWASSGIGTLRANIIDGTQRLIIDTDIEIENEARVANLICYAELGATPAVGATVVITFRFTGGVGTSSVTLTFTNGTGAAEQNVTILPSTFANEGDTIRVEILAQRTAGAGTYELLETEVEEVEVTSGLPDPDND